MDCRSTHKRRSSRYAPPLASLAIALVVLILAVTANAQKPPTSEGAIAAITNTNCPVTTDEVIDPKLWVDYKGKRVYFCCRMCKVKFEREPDAYVANLPQFAAVTGAQDDVDSGRVSSASQHAHGPTTDANDHADGHSDDHGDNHGDDAANDPDNNHANVADSHDDHDHDAPAQGGHATEDEPDVDAAEHDHAAHGESPDPGAIARSVSWVGSFHPPSVHFPIALLISGAIAEILLIFTGRTLFDSAGRFCVWIGCASAIITVALGWFLSGFHLTDTDWIMTTHRWLGTAIGAWALIILGCSIADSRADASSRHWKALYRTALFVGAAAVAINGFLGGAMIYGLDQHAW